MILRLGKRFIRRRLFPGQTTADGFNPKRTMSDGIHLQVSVPQQVLTVYAGELILWQAPVSTSAYGIGIEPNSYKTPPGWHVIAEKIGDDAPWGSVFESRRPTGEVWSPNNPPSFKDLVLTRILWLAGETPENATTQARFIYFHGTNHENKIGTPCSHGCIRLRNDAMIRLYDEVAVGTRVLIEP